MTTVGFGDVYPRTPAGKVVGTAAMLCGILLISLPIAIIGRKFQEAYMESLGELPNKEEDDDNFDDTFPGPPFLEMAFKLQRMRVQDYSEIGRLARSIADEFEEVASVQMEIQSMRRYEREKQKQTVNIFDGVLDRFLAITDEDKKKRYRRRSSMLGMESPSMASFAMRRSKDLKSAGAGVGSVDGSSMDRQNAPGPGGAHKNPGFATAATTGGLAANVAAQTEKEKQASGSQEKDGMTRATSNGGQVRAAPVQDSGPLPGAVLDDHAPSGTGLQASSDGFTSVLPVAR